MKENISLSKGERQLLMRLENLGTRAAGMSINEISEELCFSTATISRLIKKLGYSNIKEYKRFLFNEHLISTDTNERINEINKLKYKRSIIDSANNILMSDKIYLVNDDELDSLVIGLNIRKFEVILVPFEYLLANEIEDDDIIMIYTTKNDYYNELKTKFRHNRFIILNNIDKTYDCQESTIIVNSFLIENKINQTQFKKIHISSQEILMEIDKRLQTLFM